MFERYTGRARRVIFHGRFEASELGGDQIETDFLLLGVARENPKLAMRWLGMDYEKLRQMLSPQYAGSKRIATNVDMSLSNASKRVLAYAAEEADRLRDRHIGTEHLFLGLLREGGTTERMLKARRENLKSARKGVARDPDRQEMKAARLWYSTVIKFVKEDGAEVAVIPWAGGLPKIGEIIWIPEADGTETAYQIVAFPLSRTPQISKEGDPEVLITVRAERS